MILVKFWELIPYGQRISKMLYIAYSIDINGPHDHLYLYSGVAAFTGIGDRVAPILRFLPFRQMQSSTIFDKEFFQFAQRAKLFQGPGSHKYKMWWRERVTIHD